MKVGESTSVDHVFRSRQGDGGQLVEEHQEDGEGESSGGLDRVLRVFGRQHVPDARVREKEHREEERRCCGPAQSRSPRRAFAEPTQEQAGDASESEARDGAETDLPGDEQATRRAAQPDQCPIGGASDTRAERPRHGEHQGCDQRNSQAEDRHEAEHVEAVRLMGDEECRLVAPQVVERLGDDEAGESADG